MTNFKTKLDQRVKAVKSCVCIGLDPTLSRIPASLQAKYNQTEEIIFQFNRQLIETTHDLVCAYKPNIAFYEAQGTAGWQALEKTIQYIRQIDPNILVVLDAKRADIGHTNSVYVQALFEQLQVDAVTIHPYLGQEALRPFLQKTDKGLIILCRTSNPGAGEFQDLTVNSPLGTVPLYQHLAYQVTNYWNQNNNCALVVGATYPQELTQVRQIAGDLPFLIPGIGAQGGEVETTVKAGQNKQGRGMIINSSRSIIFASHNSDFAQAARQKTLELKNLINQYRLN
ncbi:MAG: orotidine-5'-phosphate decarboxylase [Patescibacteria group bacterium]|nr:orotidine-5'-phosphate decarboxylase [Patescibacteria group bacterium]